MVKVAGELPKFSSVYVSYSRRDESFMRTLYAGMLAEGMTPDDIWIDWEDATVNETWEAGVREAMSAQETFIFVITSAALDDQVCLEEIRIAEELKLKFVPIFHSDMAKDQHIPSVVSHANWVYMRDGIDNFSVVFPALIDTINTDLEYIEKHNRYKSRAGEWDDNEQKSDFLLAGNELSEGEHWLAHALEHGEPKPTTEQAEYLLISRQHDTMVKRRQRQRLGVILFIAILAACGALFFWQTAVASEADAEEKEVTAYAAGTRAQEKATEANMARETAESDRAVALTQEYLAEMAATEESVSLAEALTQEVVAITQVAIANVESTAAGAAAGTAVSAAETANAESLLRATQEAIAIAEANERATQQAIAEAEEDYRATQQAIAEYEAAQAAVQQSIAETQEAIAQVAATQAAQDAAVARARALALVAINLIDSDPQLARLLALLSYQETKNILSEPLDETKNILNLLAEHPLYYIWDVPSTTAKFIETRKISSSVTELLVYPGRAGNKSIDIYNYDTRAFLGSITLAFEPENIKLSNAGNILAVYKGDSTTATVQLFDMTSASYANQTISNAYQTGLTTSVNYASSGTLDKIVALDISADETKLVVAANNFTVTVWDISGMPSTAPVKLAENDLWDASDTDYTAGAGFANVAQVRAVAFRPTDSQYIAIGAYRNYGSGSDLSGKEAEWQWGAGSATLSKQHSPGLIYSVGLSQVDYTANGSRIIGVSSPLVTGWDRKPNSGGDFTSGHSATINSLDSSPDGKYFVTTGEGSNAIIWSLSSGFISDVASYKTYPYALRDGDFHGGNKLFAVVDANGDIPFLINTGAFLNFSQPWSVHLTKINGQMIRNKTLTPSECLLYGASNCTYTASLDTQPIVQESRPTMSLEVMVLFSIIAGSIFMKTSNMRKER